MKNIAILVPNLQSGGSERMAARLSEVLAQKYNIHMVLFDASDISYKYAGKLTVLNLPAVNGRFGKVINLLKRIRAIRKLVKEEKIDVICSFTSAADNANAYSHAKAKRLVSCRGALFLQQNLKTYKKLCRASDGILFNSEGMRKIYLEEYPEDEKKTFVLYNLFDTEQIVKNATEPLEPEFKDFMKTHRTVTAVGRFVPEKGQWNLIKSFEILKEKVPDAGLLFVGHIGDFEDTIRSMAQKSVYAADIKFTGYSDNPFKYCKNSAVYAMSSINEGFPNALVEAMAVGVPVVSTNCITGPAEILFKNLPENIPDDRYTVADYGIITPPFEGVPDFDNNNKEKAHYIFADALERMITDGELADRCIKAAASKAAELDMKNMTEKYEKLLETV